MQKGNFFVSFIGQEEHIQLIPRKAGWNSLHRTWGFWLFSSVADIEVDVRTAVTLS